MGIVELKEKETNQAKKKTKQKKVAIRIQKLLF